MSPSLPDLLISVAKDAADRGVTFRQGVVSAWSGGSNTLVVGGVTMSDLPYLDGVAPSPGDVVGLLRCANTLIVIGKIVKP